MAQTLPKPAANPLSGFMQLPVQRQLGLLVGAAMVVAIAVSIAVWGLRPTYQVLLPGMAERDVVQAMNVLGRNGIPHRLHSATGALMVPATRTHEARLQLATEGLPRAEGVGFELLDEDTGIGTSRLAESTRYQRALEGELARSVMTLASVDSARVHLALPRQSVFLRDRVRPGASVIINLRPGRDLDDTQIAGIVHMVGSSVPELEAEHVTVVDQRGRLLSQPNDGSNAHLPSRQLDHTRRVEEALRSRVEDILAPLVGERGMRVQVTAEVDFTEVESTREFYDPDSAAVRSEQLSEEEQTGQGVAGIPGALSNQPPAAGAVLAPGADAETNASNDEPRVNRNRRSVRNYELDRTISHIRQAPASLSRLSVAVVVDHRETLADDGARVRVAREAAEMEHLTTLVREAVGFNEARGDRVNVVNASFREIEPTEPLAPLALWEEPWVQELIKQGLAGLALLLVVLGVLRPALKALARPPAAPRAQQALAAPAGTALATEDSVPGGATGAKPVARTLEGDLEHARKLTQEDPRLVAQVVRQWVNEDET